MTRGAAGVSLRPVNLPDAVRISAEFLDDYIVKRDGFAPTGELDDFIIEFQETYAGEDDPLGATHNIRVTGEGNLLSARFAGGALERLERRVQVA